MRSYYLTRLSTLRSQPARRIVYKVMAEKVWARKESANAGDGSIGNGKPAWSTASKARYLSADISAQKTSSMAGDWRRGSTLQASLAPFSSFSRTGSAIAEEPSAQGPPENRAAVRYGTRQNITRMKTDSK